MKDHRKGQSIIEAAMAISVLVMGFLGLMALLTKSFFLSRVTANSFVATYLAAEGVEVVKNILDHDIFSGGTWGTCGGGCVSDGAYIIDRTTGTGLSNEDQPLTLGACPGPNLRFDPTTRQYYSGSTGVVTTTFQRCVQITHTIQNSIVTEVTVNSKVTWSTGPITSDSVNLEDHFYNWRP